MALVALQLVRFKSPCPGEDELVDWLIENKFWNQRIKTRVIEANNYLPMDLEMEFKEKFGIPFDKPTRTLFSELLRSDTGIPLNSLGFDVYECKGWEDPETCTGKLLNIRLVRVQRQSKIKALKVAFDPRAQYLGGLRNNPN